MKRIPSVILFDLWRTLGFSMDRDPILDVQEILEHNIIPDSGKIEVIEDPQFMRSCLTTNISDRRSFLEQIGGITVGVVWGHARIESISFAC